MPDFFGESLQGGRVILSAEDSHHALRVLRLKAGDALRVSVGARRYSAELEVDGGAACARVTGELPSSEAGTRITLYQGWPKGDKLEQIVRQGTELGMSAFVPVLFQRCVARPDQAERRVERLNKIAREAAMQAGRMVIPRVEMPIGFEELQWRLENHERALVLYERERATSLREALKGARDLAFIIGPEGGLEDLEVMAMKASPVTLGPRILRTETAGLAAAAMALALNDDF